MTHSQRRHNLKTKISAAGLDAMLVTDLINVRYLSGFSGSNGALLVFADDREAVLATDGR
ncbi:MAG: peptidase M24 family protein, partial [Mycobacterium sp.]